jgi:acetate CoA/acetoacetate CoA-transferase alpha subunit
VIDKTVGIVQAVAGIEDGAAVMVGGFGAPGTPFTLLDALLEAGAKDLTLIKNEGNEPGMGISKLVEAGRVRKLIASHLGLNRIVIEMMNEGALDVEIYPQGILAEKIRAGGAGLFGFLTDIGIDTDIVRETKEVIEFRGREVIIEPALTADVALIRAACADRSGNLRYEKTARNFCPLMATAAELVVAEAMEIVETGDIDPDSIHTPGAFVDRVAHVAKPHWEYGVLENHVLKE